MKSLAKCNVLNTFALKNAEKFADYDLENLCLWSLVLGLGLGFFRVLGLEGCVLNSTSGSNFFYEIVSLLNKQKMNCILRLL